MDAVVALAVVVAIEGVAWCQQTFVHLALLFRPKQAVAAGVSPFVCLGREEMKRSILLGLKCVLVERRPEH